MRRCPGATRAWAGCAHDAVVGLAMSLLLVSLASAAAPPKPARRVQAPPPPITADDAFLAMREAIKIGDLDAAAVMGQRVLSIDPYYPLAAYIDYWPMSQRLHSATNPPPDDGVRAFLAQNEGTLVGEFARRDWLLALARRGDFATFDDQYPELRSKDDPQVECYALVSRYLHVQRHLEQWSEEASVASKAALSQPANVTGEGCTLLLSLLASDNRITEADLWTWIRLASDANLPLAMKRYSLALPTADTQAALALDAIIANPALWLSRQGGDAIPGQHDLWLIALSRMARASPADTAALFSTRYAEHLSPLARSDVWAELAGSGFRHQIPDANDWTHRALDARDMPEDVWSSELRIAIRDGDWALYRSVYERIPAEMKRATANDGGWIFWLSRAERARNQPQVANDLLHQIAGQFNFYGQLATEELGQPIVLPPYAPAATEAEVTVASNQLAFGRAERFYALNLRSLGNQEWNFPLKIMTDRQLLASAEFAKRLQLYDRAVNTAERTQSEHDFRLRFLAPYYDDMRPKAEQENLALDWVYGLIRQESRFVQVAHSSAGASGLMQLMPGTARYVAKKIGMTDYSPDQVSDLSTNLTLGTSYLRMVLDQLDNVEVLATAAYNAGPGRARTWRQNLAHNVEGAIYAETIPFPETRDYVKKVMSNAVYYALVFNAPHASLKARMGVIGTDVALPPRSDLP